MANTFRRNGLLRDEDLVSNPTPRIPICLCLDTSGSMGRTFGGTRTGRKLVSDGEEWNKVIGGTSCLSEMQAGVEQFIRELRGDENARYSAEISIVTFDDRASCIVDFKGIDRLPEVPKLKTRDKTAIGEGVNLALDLLEKRKKEYKQNGVDYYQPWLVLMTDGEPNGDQMSLTRAINRSCDLVNTGKLTVFPIGIGKEADLSTLSRFSPKRDALRLQGLEFRQFFAWLSQSVEQTSRSVPGDHIALDVSLLEKLGTTEAVEGGWDKL